jgi:hypothetical protein
LDKEDWNNLSYNLIILELDLGYMKTRTDIFWENLMKNIFHPNRVMRFYSEYNYDILEDKTFDNQEMSNSKN